MGVHLVELQRGSVKSGNKSMKKRRIGGKRFGCGGIVPKYANFNAQVLCLKVVFKVRQRVAPATLALTEASALARVRYRLPASVVMELSRLLDTMATVEWPWT